MSVWTDIFLGIIAFSAVATAIVLVAVLIAAGRLAQRITRLVDNVERELGPIFGHLNAIAKDASRAAAVAGAQVDRVDRLFEDVFRRLDHVLDAFQSGLTVPAREGRAVLSAVQAVLQSLRNGRRGSRRRRSGADDEDALFI